ATDGVVQAVKRVGLDAGARVVGVAAAEAFRAGVPEGFRPEDILPGARSVVVAGGDGPTAGAWRCPDHRVMEITGYDLRENVAIPCLRACPACLSGTLKDARIETSTYDREKCHSRAQTYGIGSFQKALLAVVNEDDAGRRREMIHSDFFAKSVQSVGFFRDSIAQCFECMRVCPVGRKHRKLK